MKRVKHVLTATVTAWETVCAWTWCCARGTQDKTPEIKYDANTENPHLDVILHDFTEHTSDSGITQLRFVVFVPTPSVSAAQ